MLSHLQNTSNARINPASDKRILSATVVSVSASATIQALLTAAGGAINAAVQQVTLIPTGTVYMAVGGVASASSVPLTANVAYSFGITSVTDLRLYAAGATNVHVIQEG